MSSHYQPVTVRDAQDIVLAAASEGRPLEIRGGGTKARLGRAVQAAATLDMRAISGITLYEPAEMVIAARAGTPLREIEEALDAKGQMLPFEPATWQDLLGSEGEPTVGGLVAAGLSGPRRIAAGACRDALIGVRFINGRGEEIVSGGRVMKNVTGYDLAKLQAGAYGTLGVLTEVTFRVLPRPASSATLVYENLDDDAAVRLLCAAMGTPFEVSGAAHAPNVHGHPPLTALRLEAFPDSLSYRTAQLTEALEAFGRPRLLGHDETRSIWADVREVSSLRDPPENALWRLSTAPTRAAAVVAHIRRVLPARVLYDWSGGLVWLSVAADGDAGAAVIRATLGSAGGHATLVRAPDAVRTGVAPFQPPAEAVMRLTQGLKQTFDPAGVLNPGRMYAGL